MDFLNSTAAPRGERIDWLSDGAGLLDWLRRAGLIESGVGAEFAARERRGELNAAASEARKLREWLRGFVNRHAGRPLGRTASAELHPLNRLLARENSFSRVEPVHTGDPGDGAAGRPLHLHRELRWTEPGQLLQPIALAIADLVCNADFRHIRKCESAVCTLMFHDRSKSHARRWCSMALCGNRAKAAAHRARHRET
jgi:predicted RNA-binding Zn ribbon-like protein